MSLPKELNLGSNKPMASGGKPAILRYRSDNTTYVSGDTIRIEIPTGRQGQHLFPQDSYLEAKVKVNTSGGTGAAINTYIDQSAFSLFRRIRILHGSTVLEDTLDVNKLWTAIYDIQVNESERRGDTINKLVYDNVTAGNTSTFNSHLFGYQFVSAQAASAAATDSSLVDFAIMLPSALVGSLASKALPLSLMGASSLYIELELAPANVAFVQQYNASGGTAFGTINSFTVQDIYYNAKVTNLPSEIESAIIESTGGVVNLPAVAYKTESKSISSGSTAWNDKFSFQFSSIKNMLFFLQNQSTANGNVAYRSVSARPRCNTNEYYLNINGEVYPSQPISGLARQYTELLRSFDYLTDTNAGGVLTFSNYSHNTHTAASDNINDTVATMLTDTDQKRFIAGIDLDRFNRSSDVLMSGTSTIGQMMTLNVNFSSSLTDNVILYGACMYDVLFHLENGQLTYKV